MIDDQTADVADRLREALDDLETAMLAAAVCFRRRDVPIELQRDFTAAVSSGAIRCELAPLRSAIDSHKTRSIGPAEVRQIKPSR